MFNLPLPTDSLYKFAFMFGILLIVFSFYFRGNELNRFDKKQSHFALDENLTRLKNQLEKSELDSTQIAIYLNIGLEQQTKSNNASFTDTLEVSVDEFSREGVKEVEFTFSQSKAFRNSLLKETLVITDLNYYIRSVEYLMKDIKLTKDTKTRKISEEISSLKSKIKLDELYFTLLLTVGCILFLGGAILWYFLIQSPQDKLLQIQLSDVQKKTITSKEYKIRKHFEPQILPRPRLKNR